MGTELFDQLRYLNIHITLMRFLMKIRIIRILKIVTDIIKPR